MDADGGVGLSASKEPGHVLDKDEGGLDLSDDADDRGPDPSLVVSASPLAGDAPGLAREARRDEIHDATPRSAVERCKVVPDRSEIQGLVLHPGHEHGRGEGFPLDVAYGAIASGPESHSEPKIEPRDPRTKSQPMNHRFAFLKSSAFGHVVQCAT
jgi:hypothetical protein